MSWLKEKSTFKTELFGLLSEAFSLRPDACDPAIFDTSYFFSEWS